MFDDECNKIEPCSAPNIVYQKPDVSSRLKQRRIELKAELDQIDNALRAMSNVPQVSEVINTLSKLNFRL